MVFVRVDRVVAGVGFGFGSDIAGVGDPVHVVAGAAVERVVAAQPAECVVAAAAAEPVGRLVAADQVGQRIAGAVDRCGAGEPQVLEVGAQGPADAAFHHVLRARDGAQLADDVAGRVDHVRVVAVAARQQVETTAADERVVAVAAGQRIAAAASGQAVVARAAVDKVVAVEPGGVRADHGVVAVAGVDHQPVRQAEGDRRDRTEVVGVGAGRAEEVGAVGVEPLDPRERQRRAQAQVACEQVRGVGTDAAVDDPARQVGDRVQVEMVVARFAVHRVDARTADEHVVAFPAVQEVVAGVAGQRVVAAEAVDRVVAGGARQVVRVVVAVDGHACCPRRETKARGGPMFARRGRPCLRAARAFGGELPCHQGRRLPGGAPRSLADALPTGRRNSQGRHARDVVAPS